MCVCVYHICVSFENENLPVREFLNLKIILLLMFKVIFASLFTVLR